MKEYSHMGDTRASGTWGGHGRGLSSSSSLFGSGGMLLRCQALLQGLNAFLSCCSSFQALSLLTGQLQYAHTHIHTKQPETQLLAIMIYRVVMIAATRSSAN